MRVSMGFYRSKVLKISSKFLGADSAFADQDTEILKGIQRRFSIETVLIKHNIGGPASLGVLATASHSATQKFARECS